MSEFPVRDKNKHRIVKHFRSVKFACIRCGSKKIEINEIQPHVNRIKYHRVGQSARPKNDMKMSFYVSALLSCTRCNHRFHIRILDQGIRNTNVYFDNSLS